MANSTSNIVNQRAKELTAAIEQMIDLKIDFAVKSLTPRDATKSILDIEEARKDIYQIFCEMGD